MFSSDSNILKSDSAVAQRIIAYSAEYDSLDIILLNTKTGAGKGLPLDAKVSVFATNALVKVFAPIKAFFLCAKLIFGGDFKIDKTLIIAQDPFEIGLSAFMIHLFTKIPLELQLHTDVLSPYFVSHTFKNRVRTYIARCLIPQADKVRVVSNKIKEGLIVELKIPAEKIEVRPVQISVRNEMGSVGVSVRQKYPGCDKYILMVSRLTSEKNYFFALDVVKELVSSSSLKIALVIVGDGPLKAILESRVSQLGLGDKVKFEGWQENMFSYYRSADVLFHAALYEGYGMVLKEAEQAGLQVISSDVGIAREIANARVYPVNNKEAALAELKQVLGI